MPTTSPTVLRRQVAAELRRLRERGQLTLTQAAQELGWHTSKLSRIETAATGVRKGDLERLLRLYDVGEQDRVRLVALAAQSRQRGWWDAYGDALPDAYTTYIGFEAEASVILSYQPSLIFGLLQTAEYATAVVHASKMESSDVITQRVSARLARQAVLIREPPPRLHVILDEAALRRPIGGSDVMRRQMLRLIEVGERAQTTVQVLPVSVGSHDGLGGSFVLLELLEGADPPLVYCEDLTGGVIRSRPGQVELYYRCFRVLQSAAFDEEMSREFLIRLSRGVK